MKVFIYTILWCILWSIGGIIVENYIEEKRLAMVLFGNYVVILTIFSDWFFIKMYKGD